MSYFRRPKGGPAEGRPVQPSIEQRKSVVIRFAGDSGDGMQLTGTQFTETSAIAGNDLATFPDFPAEIRAPAGTLAGVSGFQVQFGSQALVHVAVVNLRAADHEGIGSINTLEDQLRRPR